MTIDIVEGAQPRAGGSPPVYDVIAPQAGEVLDLTILSERIRGVMTHWVSEPGTERRMCVACTHDEGACGFCGHGRAVWLGFLACYHHARKSRVILRVGLESAKALAARVAPSKTIRGRRVEVCREGRSRTRRLTWAVSQHDPLSPLPDAHGLDATLHLILRARQLPTGEWSAKELREGDE